MRLIETINLVLSLFESPKTVVVVVIVISPTQPQTVLSYLSFISLGFRDLALRCTCCPNFPLVKLSSVQFVIRKFNRTKNKTFIAVLIPKTYLLFILLDWTSSEQWGPKNGEWLLFENQNTAPGVSKLPTFTAKPSWRLVPAHKYSTDNVCINLFALETVSYCWAYVALKTLWT